MNKRTLIASAFVLGIASWLAGCGTPAGLVDDSSDEGAFLGITLSSFDETRTLPVQEDSLASEATDESLPQDLLTNVSDEVKLILSAPDIAVKVQEDSELLTPASAGVARHATVTFRVAVDSDACASGKRIGPFGITVVDDEVELDVESVSLSAAARSVVRNGRFEICAQTEGDFDGVLAVGKLTLEFGKLGPNEDKVELCHIPPGDPENLHTITVGALAVDAHLAHGDLLGACEADEDEDDVAIDSDGDGVADEVDACPNTLESEAADTAGCSCSQRDADGDGVSDCDDGCMGTESGTAVDANGCPLAPPDTDEDGVIDESDVCLNTPTGEIVDASGCSCSQLDEDADGVVDCDDFCPNTEAEVSVDSFGCEVATADAGQDVTLDEVNCVTLHGTASGGTPPYIYTWSAPGWAGSLEQNPAVVPAATTTYLLTVTDFSFPPLTVTDTVTVTLNTHEGLQYTIVDLGSLSTNSSYPAGMNDAGDVVGFYFTEAFQKRAFLFSNGAMTDIGDLGGGEASATDINNAGDVVGQSKTAADEWHAFLWSNVDGMQDLGTLGGGTSVANAINEIGEVAGSSATGSATHAFLYTDGVMEDVDVLDSVYSEAYDVNDSGVVVGMLLANGSNPQALVYDGGSLLSLGAPSLVSSRAWAINNSGLIVGHAWDIGEYVSFLSVCDTAIDLGALDGFPKTSVWGVNEAGQIVGSASSATSTLFNAFVYTGGRIHNLNELLVDGAEWEYLSVAFAVNSSGQITGYGRINGQFRGFLMTPAP